jgi:aspartyl/asparaginyl beta-hydroxylase (cupin superfamily)
MNATPIIEWYSFAEGDKYSGDEPAFFDINHLPWKKVLEDNYLLFLKELKLLIEKNDDQIIPYFNETLASEKNNWTIFPLMVWGKEVQENCKKCPATYEIIQSIEGVTSCAFSMLKPNTSIKPHLGDSNVMYRVHVTLESNGQLPEMGMRVKDKTIDWKNGEVFAFCDAHEHEVWNNTDTNRYVLIIDILREPFIHKKNQICAKINATLFWQLKFQRFYFIKHLPKFIRRAMMNATAFFIHKK